MRIKIGNFNYLNSKEDNKVNFSSYYSVSDLFNYFYLDGKEDTLYVNSRINFDRAEEQKNRGFSFYDFERELLKKYLVIDYNIKITNEVNSFIQSKALKLFCNNNYSRYDLYNNINFSDIAMLEQNSKYILGNEFESYIDFQNNKIVKNGIIFNPYLDKLENLEELYKDGIFNKQIKASLIKLEVEKNVAPKFITTLININNFMKDKKSVNILFKYCEKSKINPHIRSFLDLRDNKINLELGYNEEKFFKKANAGKEAENLTIDDLQGLSYFKEILNINPNDFKELEKQIAITIEDKFLFKIDKLKEEVKDDYRHLMYEYHRKEAKIGSNYINFPYNIQDALNIITKIDVKNSQLNPENLKIEKENYPEWYSNELENLFVKYNSIKKLENVDTIDDLKEIVNEIGDNELKQIYYEFLNKGEITTEDEEEI